MDSESTERSSLKVRVLPSQPSLKRDVNMDKDGVNKVKAEIANLRRIANVLPPGAVKMALAKRAAALGKKISPYVSTSA